jgi:hypothetical protein
MAIEVLQDIISELADKMGIYGAHGEEEGYCLLRQTSMPYVL